MSVPGKSPLGEGSAGGAGSASHASHASRAGGAANRATGAGGASLCSNCESCEHYDYDEEWDEYVCRVDLDEDEMIRFLSGTNASCPYYKFYDEYKSVQKQN